MLREHVLYQLPGLVAEAFESFKDTEANLKRPGEPRDTVSNQQRYLLHSGERVSTLIGHAINGVYFNPFFSDAMQNGGYEKRLCAVVQNRLSDFSDAVERKECKEELLMIPRA